MHNTPSRLALVPAIAWKETLELIVHYIPWLELKYTPPRVSPSSPFLKGVTITAPTPVEFFKINPPHLEPLGIRQDRQSTRFAVDRLAQHFLPPTGLVVVILNYLFCDVIRPYIDNTAENSTVSHSQLLLQIAFLRLPHQSSRVWLTAALRARFSFMKQHLNLRFRIYLCFLFWLLLNGKDGAAQRDGEEVAETVDLWRTNDVILGLKAARAALIQGLLCSSQSYYNFRLTCHSVG